MKENPRGNSKTVRLELARATGRYLSDLEAADRSQATMRWYRQKFHQLQETVTVEWLDDLDRAALQDFIAGLRKRGRSSAYLRGWYQVFRSFFGWCRQEGYAVHPSVVSDAPTWFALRKPSSTEAPITTYTREQVERILEAAGGRRNQILIRLLVGTGLRLSEALALSVDDIEEDRVRVRQGKGRKPRTVPVNSRLQRELHRYVEFQRPEVRTDRLLLNIKGEPWSEWGVRSLMARLSKKTGLRVHAHAFRHTYATTYLREGGDLHRLQRILGHTTITMTLRYAHLTGVDLARDIDDLTY